MTKPQAYGWGFSELEIDRDMLGIGKIGIVKAAGVYPDGTPFVIPTEPRPWSASGRCAAVSSPPSGR